MKKLLLMLALVVGAATASAQATDASGVPPINQDLPPAGTAAPAAPAMGQRAGRPRHAPLPPDQQAAHQTQRLSQALALSADQQGKVQQILLGQYQQQAAARQQLQATGQRRGMGRALQANRAQTDDQLRQVLSADQYAHYQQLLAQRKQQAQQRRQQPMGGSGGSLLDD